MTKKIFYGVKVSKIGKGPAFDQRKFFTGGHEITHKKNPEQRGRHVKNHNFRPGKTSLEAERKRETVRQPTEQPYSIMEKASRTTRKRKAEAEWILLGLQKDLGRKQ